MLTEIHVADNIIAFMGILKVRLTRIHKWEKGNAPSRETAQSVQEEVVAINYMSVKKL
jgi:hypothetical protein